MSEWRPSYSPRVLWIMFVCLVRGHDWDYFTLTNLDGTPAHFRCCLRCERSEELAQ
mgnify:CR=1 FL=1